MAQPARHERRNATLAALAALAAATILAVVAAVAAVGCILPLGGTPLFSRHNGRTVRLRRLAHVYVPTHRCGRRRHRRATAAARLRARIFGDCGAHTLAHGRIARAARDEVAAAK